MTSNSWQGQVEVEFQNEDVLGFTKQTAMVLRGLGAGDFLKEFKKRNVSTRMLMDLTMEDFTKFGIDEAKAKEIHTRLGNVSGRNKISKAHYLLLTSKDYLIELLRNGNKQLSLIQAFMAYARLRLSREPQDSFLDPDKPLRSSEAFRIATEATIRELDEVERSLVELEKSINGK